MLDQILVAAGSNRRVSADPALTPIPVIGTLIIMLLLGLVTTSVAARGDGHSAGGVPTAHVSSGAKVIVITQGCPDTRSKGCPDEGAPLTPHVSVSAKLASPLLLANASVRPSNVLEASASVIVCIVGGVPRT